MATHYVKEIYDHVLPEMAANNIEDTTENRIKVLTGLQTAWSEEPSGFAKLPWMFALGTEILRLRGIIRQIP
jgi:hypothetical protein